MSRRGIIAVLVGFALAAAGVWVAVSRLYLKPAGARGDRIAEARAAIERVEASLTGREALRVRMDALGATMIAGEPDEVEHRLREGLTAVGHRAGLSGVALGNGRPAGETSPVARAIGRTDLGKVLRSGPDFQVVRGWMTGTGSLAEVWSCLALLQSQAWVHRVEGFSVTPANAERTRYKLRADIATLVAGGVPRTLTDTTDLREPDAPTREAVLAIAGAYPFGGRPAPQAPVAAVLPPAEPAPPYDQWRVTGLIEAAVPEALLVNEGTGERLVLLRGDSVLDARFEGGHGEVLVFSVGGRRQGVLVGRTLGEREDLGTIDPGAAAPGGAQALRSEVQP
jgi:hypothetical protein